jgi:lysozyme
MMTSVGPRSLALIRHFESCRLHAYQDEGGVYTIGWGETGPDVVKGAIWTQELADARFAKRIAEFAGYVIPLLGGASTTPAQFGAFVSAAYNAGPGNLKTSPMMTNHHAGDFASAAEAWRGWHVHDRHGNLEPGLPIRRAAEASLYLNGDWA